MAQLGTFEMRNAKKAIKRKNPITSSTCPSLFTASAPDAYEMVTTSIRSTEGLTFTSTTGAARSHATPSAA